MRQFGTALNQSFVSIQAMTDYQVDRELELAVKVSQMSPDEWSAWLKDTWGRLQDQGSSMCVGQGANTARCFPTMAAKNAFDEEREIEEAVALALRRTSL